MKAIFQLMIWVIAASFGLSQPRIVEKTSTISKGDELILDFQFADEINIQTWNKNEIYIKASVNINDNEDNDAFRLDIERFDDKVLATSEIENLQDLSTESITITKDDDGNYIINNCNVKLDLYFEVFIPEGIELNVKTISGDIVIKGFEDEMDINTISGFIDLSLSPRSKSSIKMSTISGEMFSNMELEYPNGKEGLKRVCGQDVDATINGGGTSISLETISGNIYLRTAS